MNPLKAPIRYRQVLAWPKPWRLALCIFVLLMVAVLGGIGGSGQHAGVSQLRGYVSNLAHQPLYAAVGLSFLLALGKPARWRHWPVLSLFVLAVGLADEWHQSTVPFRDASYWDLLSDLLGITIGLILAIASDRDPPLRTRLGLVFFLISIGLAWNCIPSFAPPWELPFAK